MKIIFIFILSLISKNGLSFYKEEFVSSYYITTYLTRQFPILSSAEKLDLGAYSPQINIYYLHNDKWLIGFGTQIKNFDNKTPINTSDTDNIYLLSFYTQSLYKMQILKPVDFYLGMKSGFLRPIKKNTSLKKNLSYKKEIFFSISTILTAQINSNLYLTLVSDLWRGVSTNTFSAIELGAGFTYKL
jgi:hypothetical protein